MPKASLHVAGQMVVLLGRDSIAEHRPVAGVADSGSRGHRPRLQLCRQDCRERYFPIDGLRKNVFNRSPDFRSIAIDYPDLLALFEWAAGHHLK